VICTFFVLLSMVSCYVAFWNLKLYKIFFQMILKQKLRGQGMAFLVGGGSGTDCFALVT
jgi:hypothetical protein